MGKARNGILVDKETHDASNLRFSFTSLPKITVKGKTDPIEIFSPRQELRMKKKNSCKNSIAHHTVGRQQEKETLTQLSGSFIDDSDVPASSVVVIRGEGGVGKTRIINYATDEFKKANLSIFYCSAEYHQSQKPYFVWIPILESIISPQGFPNASHSHRAESKCLLENKNYFPLLSSLLQQHSEKSPELPFNLTSKKKSEITFSLVSTLLKEALQPRTLVVVHNVQWMDSASVDILRVLLNSTNGVLFVLSMLHSDTSFSIPKGKISHIIELKNFTLHETSLFVSELLSNAPIPFELAEAVYQKSQGNPFITKEIVFGLKKTGALSISNESIILSEDFAAQMQSIPSSGHLDFQFFTFILSRIFHS